MGNNLRKLGTDEIEKLASRPGVRRKTVENLLNNLCTPVSVMAIKAGVYRSGAMNCWSEATVRAILDGIDLAGKTRVIVE